MSIRDEIVNGITHMVFIMGVACATFGFVIIWNAITH